MCTNDFNSRVVMRQKPHSFARAMIYEVFYLLEYGVTYRSKFSQGIFPIEKLIFVSEIN